MKCLINEFAIARLSIESSGMKMETSVIIVLLVLAPFASAIQLSCSLSMLSFFPWRCSLNKLNITSNGPFSYSNFGSEVTDVQFTSGTMANFPSQILVDHPTVSVVGVSLSNLAAITPSDFQNMPQLQGLRFAVTNITQLQANTFQGCPNLLSFQLSQGVLQSIDVNAFSGLIHMNLLDLAKNAIKIIPPGLFDSLLNISTIRLNNNQIGSLDPLLFRNTVVLQMFDVRSNQITQIPAGLFNGIPNMNDIAFSNNQLTNGSAFNSEWVDFSENMMTTFYVTGPSNHIVISDNFITTLSCDTNLFNVTTFIAANNSLSTMKCINLMHNVTNLDISFNKFTVLKKKAFLNLLQLKYLDLEGNLFKKLNPTVLSPLIELVGLTVSNFTAYNNLRTLLPKLYKLKLATNNWNCTKIANIGTILNSQKIAMEFDNGLDYNRCKTKLKNLNHNIS